MSVFVYCHLPTRKAWAQRTRFEIDLTTVGKVIFLFECERAWSPVSQASFEKACQFKGILCGHTFTFNPEVI